jgi:hypothetical protein
MSEDQRHDWTISSAVAEENIYAVAICARCGVARSEYVGRRSAEGHLDLGGSCPAEKPADDPDHSPFAIIG